MGQSGQRAVLTQISKPLKMTAMALLLLTGLIGIALAPETGMAAAKSPFSMLKGSWKGNGTFSLQSGAHERISCNAYYTGSGAQLGLAILCSSAVNKIHMRGKVSYHGGRVSGTWEERTYNADGRLNGSASSNRIDMRVSGNVNGSMNVSYSKRQQQVSINISGSPLTAVNITLRR